MNGPFRSAFIYLMHLAWKSRLPIPFLLTVCLLVFDIRLQIEVNINLTARRAHQRLGYHAPDNNNDNDNANIDRYDSIDEDDDEDSDDFDDDSDDPSDDTDENSRVDNNDVLDSNEFYQSYSCNRNMIILYTSAKHESVIQNYKIQNVKNLCKILALNESFRINKNSLS